MFINVLQISAFIHVDYMHAAIFKTERVYRVYCQLHFNFDMSSILWTKRARTFDIKFSASDNMFCKHILHQVCCM